MSEKQEKILYVCTCGKDRSETAHMPFVLANAALKAELGVPVWMHTKDNGL